MKWTKAGNWYVDSVYGNDTTGNGTKENPYRTLGRAYTAASNGHRVICSGFFNEVVLTAKTLHWEGDGFALMSGQGRSANEYGFNAYLSITDFLFIKFQGTSYSVSHGSTKPIRNCQFYFCNVAIENRSPNFANCVFYEVSFNALDGGVFVPVLRNNTFFRCSGGDWRFSFSGALVVNNHFEECANLSFSLPLISTVNTEFDYNTIIGTLNINGSAMAQAGQGSPNNANTLPLFGSPAYNVNGKGNLLKANLVPPEQFLVSNSGTNDLNWYRTCFALVPNSVNVNAGKGGVHIGAKSVGYILTANAIWTNRNIGTVDNLEYDAVTQEIKRTNEANPGSLETGEIDLGASFLTDVAQLAAQVIDMTTATLSVLGRVDYNVDPAFNNAVDQKTVFDFEMQYGTIPGALSGWKKFEFNKIVSVDAGAFGNADDNYTLGSGLRIQMRYIRIRIGIRSI